MAPTRFRFAIAKQFAFANTEMKTPSGEGVVVSRGGDGGSVDAGDRDDVGEVGADLGLEPAPGVVELVGAVDDVRGVGRHVVVLHRVVLAFDLIGWLAVRVGREPALTAAGEAVVGVALLLHDLEVEA